MHHNSENFRSEEHIRLLKKAKASRIWALMGGADLENLSGVLARERSISTGRYLAF